MVREMRKKKKGNGLDVEFVADGELIVVFD
jgi:hypothetical protein